MRLRSFLLVGSLLTTVVLGVLVARQRMQEPAAPPAPVPSAGTVGEGAAPDTPFPGELPLITIEGWNPVAGHVDRADDDGYRAPAPLTLELGGLEVTFAPGSEFAFAEGLPQLRSGSMEVRARLETDYGRYRLPAGGSIGITPDKVTIGQGGVLVDGTLIPGGTKIPRRSTLERSASENPAATDRASGPDGLVVDGRDGAPIAGATVRIILSDQPEGSPRAAGVAAPVTVTTGPDGHFSIPTVARFLGIDPAPAEPENPAEPDDRRATEELPLTDAARLWLRLEVSAPGYAPVEHRTVDPRTLDDTWPFPRIVLHRSWLATVRFLLPDKAPVAGATVRVVEEADPYVPESGVLVQREGDRWVSRRTTDASGALATRRPFERLTLEHPWIVPFPSWELRPSWAGDADEDGVDATGRPVPITALHEVAPTIETFELVDADGFPVADTALEITIPEEGRSFRMRTDGVGRFTVGIADRHPEDVDVVALPKEVTLRVLDPRLRDMTRTFSIPGHPERLYLDGRPSPLVRMQLVDLVDGSDVVAVPAEQFVTNADLTLLSRDRRGGVVLTGDLPGAGVRFELAVRDRLPTSVLIPDRIDRESDLDLGTIVLEPGVRTVVTVHGVSSDALEGAVLEISGDEEMLARRTLHPLRGGARTVVGGLDPLRFYRFRVTGPWLREASGEFRLSDIDAQVGLVIPCFERELDRVTTVGKVAGLLPHETRRYRVIERHERGLARDPAIERSVPLAPDGTFGAEHFVDGLARSEAFVLGQDALFAHAPLRAPQEWGEVFHDPVGPEEPRVARVHYRIAEVGIGFPPETRFHAGVDRNEELLTVRERFLPGVLPFVEARFLIPGEYQVRWSRPGFRDGSRTFEVGEETREVQFVVDLPPAETNRIALVVLDPEGLPVSGARVSSRAVDPKGTEGRANEADEVAPGVYAVTLVRRLETRVSVRPVTDAGLPAELVIPAGAEFEGPLQLIAPASFVAEVEDPSGRSIDGVLEVTAQAIPFGSDPERGIRVRHGTTVLATIDRGVVAVPGVPSGPMALDIVHPSTSTSAVLDLELLPGNNQLESPIELGDRRRFTGVVIEEGDIGVAGAEVLLVEPGAEHRYPLRPIDPARVVRQTTAGAGGVFEFDLTGIPEDARLALVARSAGFTASVLSPVDLDGPPATLFLRPGSRLRIIAERTGSGFDPNFDRFRLSYLSNDSAEGTLALGDLPNGTRDDHFDVRPGTYRLEWGPESSWTVREPPAVEVTVRPGLDVELDLTLERTIVRAVGNIDGAPLARGWILIGRDPADLTLWSAAPLVDGVATVAVAPGTFPVHAVAVERVDEELEDLAAIDFARGTALPVEIPSSRLREEIVVVPGSGPTVTFTFNAAVLADPRAQLVIPRWVFEHGEWVRDGDLAIPITGPSIVLPQMRAGVLNYTVESAGPGGWSIHLSVNVADEDVTVPIIR